MALDLAAAKAQLNILDDQDNDLIERKLAAAISYMNRRLGFDLQTQFTADIPADLEEAVLQLVAHWYENREGVVVGVNAQVLPHSINDVINEYRNWSF